VRVGTVVVTSREIGDVVVFDIEGNVTRSRPLHLHEAVKSRLEEGKVLILLNFEKMGFIDSSGVGELFSSFKSITDLGGALKLARISPEFRLILEVTRLIEIFRVFDTVDDALADFSQK
jgi:anti-anti-sigma factor